MGRGTSNIFHRDQRTELAFGSLQFANNAFAAFSGLYLPFIYLEQQAIAPWAFGTAMILATLVQSLTALAIGARAQTSGIAKMRGKMLLAGAIPFAISFALVVSPPDGAASSVIALWLLGTLIVASASRSMFEVSYTSILADLSSGGRDRTRLANFRQIFATAGEASATLLPSLGLALGFAAASFGAFGVAMAVWILGTSLWMRARLKHDRRLSRQIMQGGSREAATIGQDLQTLRLHLASAPLRTLMGSYATAMIGIRLTVGLFPFIIISFAGGQGQLLWCMAVFIAGSLAGLPLWGRVAAHCGRAAALRYSLMLSGCIVFAMITVAQGGAIVFVLLGLMGAASVAITSFGVALQADLVDLEQQRLGIRSTAAIAGIYVMVLRASQGFGTALVGGVILVAQIGDHVDPYLILLPIFSIGGGSIFLLAAYMMRRFPSKPSDNSKLNGYVKPGPVS